MAIKSRYTRVPVPSLSSRKTQTVAVSFDGGIKTFPPNDNIKYTEVALAQDMRMVRWGNYRTRKGADLFTDAIGKSPAITIDTSLPTSTQITAKDTLIFAFTPTTDFRLWSIELEIGSMRASGVLSIGIYEGRNGQPGLKIAETTISATDLSSTTDTTEARFIAAPDLSAQSEYFVVVQTQRGARGAFLIGTGEDGTGVMISHDGGETWTSYDSSLTMVLNSAEDGEIRNIFVAKRGDVLTTFFVFNGVLYRADELGNVTVQNNALPGGVRNIYFSQSQDFVRYVYGVGEARKISLADFSEEEILAGRGGARNIYENGGFLFYFSSADPNGVYTSQAQPFIDLFDVEYSWISSVPSPKCGDDLTAMSGLGGALYFFTRRNKYVLLGDTWQSFSLNSAASRKGTFSQDSIVTDTSFIYYASDDGIYMFNGTSEKDLTEESIQDIWNDVSAKETCKLDIHDNRLYVFYSDLPTRENNKCLVYNLNLGLWESFDTDTYISATCARTHPTNQFIAGSSRVGALYKLETSENRHHNIGAPIRAELRTAYMHFGQPAQIKRMPKLRPEFEKEDLPYSVECGFANNFEEQATYAFSVGLGTGAIMWDSGFHWDDGNIWRENKYGTVTTTKPHVFGEFNRTQLRYRHFAAYEPFTFISHTMTVQTQRLR